ncbi:patatin-like phospholipase family protein [Legionella sp. W05-934-2]|jgi:NTE family protein|uniref:patatin-like phospholipase family protein n=1 Tax=Legionella sp. W05-934-2 TaxID=1198649 RepID=UPI003462AE44
MSGKKKLLAPKFDSIACSLQGGGALGAYQVGVLKALHEAEYDPDWFVGTSIGAINAAICAGNQKQNRIEKLIEFWYGISRSNPLDSLPVPDDVAWNRCLNYWSAQSSLIQGQDGFFHLRFPPPNMSWHDDPKLLSYYDTSPLRQTLEKLIDFDWLNSGKVRLSLGAVEITSGEITYFDSKTTTIKPEHIMASGALPPGFPAVEVDGKLYWDGGISSNTPVNYVLTDRNAKIRLCFMIHLFDSFGLKPKSLDDILKRKKDIEFSSRFTKTLEMYKVIHKLRYQIDQLSQLIPETKCNEPIIKECIRSGRDHHIALVRFLNKGSDTDLSSKDYEFSKRSIDKLIKDGYEQAVQAVKKSVWNQPIPPAEGIALYDTAKEYPDLNKEIDT